MKVGDIIVWRDEEFGYDRHWKILSIILGALDHEGVIEMRPVGMKPGSDVDGRRLNSVYVPEVLLRGLEIYEPLKVLEGV